MISGRQQKVTLAASLPARGVTNTPAPRTAERSCLRDSKQGTSSSGVRCMTAELRNISVSSARFGRRRGLKVGWQRPIPGASGQGFF